MDLMGMRLGMNWSLMLPLLPMPGHLWSLFAEVVALCFTFWPSVNPSALAFQGSNP